MTTPFYPLIIASHSFSLSRSFLQIYVQTVVATIAIVLRSLKLYETMSAMYERVVDIVAAQQCDGCDGSDRDEILREGTDGYVVAFGDAVYRCLDAVETLKADLGVNIGLINKPTINVADPDMMNMLAACPLVLVVEPLSKKTGLGSKFGTWLLEADCRRDGTMTTMPKFDRINTHHDGSGGLWEQAYHQGYDSESIQVKLKAMLK